MKTAALLCLALLVGCGGKGHAGDKQTYHRTPDGRLNCDFLVTGEEGELYPLCDFVEAVKIIDENSCIVIPFSTDSVASGDPIHGASMNRIVTKPHSPLLLKNWTTKGVATGQRYPIDGQVFRVTGTQDVPRNGATFRVQVLELVK